MAPRPPPSLGIVAVLLTLVGIVGGGVWLVAGAPERDLGAIEAADPAAGAPIDLAAIHRRFVPAWTRAPGQVRGAAWDQVVAAAAPDPVFGALARRLGEAVAGDPQRGADEIDAVVGAWNDALASASGGWRLSAVVEGDRWVLRSYRILRTDLGADVGGTIYPMRLLRRVDTASAADGWLGHVGRGGDGIVLSADAIAGLTLDQLWPMLDPVLDPVLDPLQARFAPAVRAEVAGWIGSEVVPLEATAEDRFWMIRAATRIYERHRCGGEITLSHVPYDGLSTRDLRMLQAAALQGAPDDPCPDVTREEALVFATRTQHVGAQPGVLRALEGLAAGVARGVAIHEARHAADLDQHGGAPPPCPGCPEGMGATARLEASAYLSSFAHPGGAAVALYQACALPEDVVPDRVAVVKYLADQLIDDGCGGIPPPDLAERARALEQRLLLRDDAVGLVGFPNRFPVASESP